jgi:peptide/nickel transport system permease protein
MGTKLVTYRAELSPKLYASHFASRTTDAFLSLFAVSAIMFVLLHLAPGDPLTATQGDPRVTPAVRAAWRAAFDADASWPVQYFRMWRSALEGNLGWSWSQQRAVADVLADALPYTLWLMGLALATSAVGGGALGVWLAVREQTRTAQTLRVILEALAAVPEVFLALLLVGALAVTIPLFPMQGACDVRRCGELPSVPAVLDLLRHSVLPVLTLTLVTITSFARMQRAMVMPTLRSTLVQAAHARGIPGSTVLRRYVLRRTLVPWIGMVGLALPALIGGAVFVERVFGWPGIGSIMLGAIGARDYPLVMAIAMLGGIITCLGGVLTDVALLLIDPRQNHQSPP